MTSIKDSINSAVDNRWVKMFVALTLFLTAGAEVWNGINELEVGAHHGVLLFSIVDIIKTLPEFFEGAKDFAE